MIPSHSQPMRKSILFLLILSILASISLLPATSSSADTGATTRLRIGVSADGIYHITADDLANAGIDPGAVDPRTFDMSSLGQAVAIRVIGL